MTGEMQQAGTSTSRRKASVVASHPREASRAERRRRLLPPRLPPTRVGPPTRAEGRQPPERVLLQRSPRWPARRHGSSIRRIADHRTIEGIKASGGALASSVHAAWSGTNPRRPPATSTSPLPASKPSKTAAITESIATATCRQARSSRRRPPILGRSDNRHKHEGEEPPAPAPRPC